MKTTTETTANTAPPKLAWLTTLAMVGFILMLAAPGFLAFADTKQMSFSAETAAVIAWICFVAPGVGALCSILCLSLWKKAGVVSRALSIVTIIVCNPYFYYYYYWFCMAVRFNITRIALVIHM